MYNIVIPDPVPGTPEEPELKGAITSTTPIWNNGKASVTLSTTKGYIIEYKVTRRCGVCGGDGILLEGNDCTNSGCIDGKTSNTELEEVWKKGSGINKEVTITGLEHGNLIAARLINESNAHGDEATVEIKDGIAPTVTISSTSSISDSITVNVGTATDSEWGMPTSPTYVYYYKTGTGSYTQFASTTSKTATKSGLTHNTAYTVKVEVKDKAGNTGSKTGTVTTKQVTGATDGLATGAITHEGPTWSNGKASITVTNLDHNDVIYARLKDASNNYGAEASVTVVDGTAPTVTISSTSSTSNSITVNVGSATDSEWGMPTSPTYVYYYKTGTGTYTEFANTTNKTATKSGLTHNTAYTVKVEVKDKAGNTGSKTGTVTTKQVTGATDGLATGAITHEGPTWSNGKASVTLKTTSGYTIQYQVNSTTGTWTSATAANASITVTNLDHNDVIYARLKDASNNYGAEATVTVVDGTVPASATISFSSSTITTETSTTATVVHTDNQSGVNIASCKWVLTTSSTKIGTTASLYTGGSFSTSTQTSSTATTSTNQITLSSSTSGTYYLHVLTVDKAGKATETVSTSAITVNTAPTTPTVTLSSKTTNSITVTANATDSDGHKLTYKLYVGGTLKKTSSATASGTTVTLEATGLSEYTTYSYYVTVTDGYATSKSTSKSVTTYCPGGEENSEVCETCNGTGQVEGRDVLLSSFL